MYECNNVIVYVEAVRIYVCMYVLKSIVSLLLFRKCPLFYCVEWQSINFWKYAKLYFQMLADVFKT